MAFVPHEKKPLLARILDWLNEPDDWPAWVQFFLLPRSLGHNNFFTVRIVLLVAMAFFTLLKIALIPPDAVTLLPALIITSYDTMSEAAWIA